MASVFDQLSWELDTDTATLLQLVSTQLDAQEHIRQQVRAQLVKDYPPEALSWLPTVTWSAPTLVPLSSFDLRGVQDWPIWDDKAKIKAFTEKIESGWHKPIVVMKVPGARYLNPIDGHTRLAVNWKLRRPVLAFVGRAHSVSGPWEEFHGKQRGMSPAQRKTSFTGVSGQLVELSVVTEDEYQQLLLARRAARAEYTSGHPERVAAERQVRKARKLRMLSARPEAQNVVEAQLAITKEISEAQDSANQAMSDTSSPAPVSHDDLLTARKKAQQKYPPGHPERVKAERAVRRSRSTAKSKTTT